MAQAIRAAGYAACSAWNTPRACTTSPRCDRRTRRMRSGTGTIAARAEGILPGATPRMLRRISTKLVLAVLVAVVLPFVGFAFFLNEQMAERLTRHVVQQALLGLVKDLAGQLNKFVDERRSDLEQWADAPLTGQALDNYFFERGRRERLRGGEGEAVEDGQAWVWNAQALELVARGELSTATFDLGLPYRAELTRELDRYADLKIVYDLVLLVANDGRLVTCTSRQTLGGKTPLSRPMLEYLFAYDYTQADWFRVALESGDFVRQDHHLSPFHPTLDHTGARPLDAAYDYHLGFAAPVRSGSLAGEVRGVLFGLVNWYHVQDLVSK